MYGCQQNLIHTTPNTRAVIEYLCSESNKVYNCALYYARQMLFKTGTFVKRAAICSEMSGSSNRHFKAMYVSSAQQTCNSVAEAMSSYKELLKLWKSGKLTEKPRPPKYRKPGFFTVSYPVRWLKLTPEGIRIPLGQQVKAWFGLGEIYLHKPSNPEWKDIKEIRILPRNRCFYAEFIYVVKTQKIPVNPNSVLGIDHGIDNWLTCVSNVGTSFIVDGKRLKSLNQWYNKQIANRKQGKPHGFWSQSLSAITEKRNRQVRDAINKAARLVINHCLYRTAFNQYVNADCNAAANIVRVRFV